MVAATRGAVVCAGTTELPLDLAQLLLLAHGLDDGEFCEGEKGKDQSALPPMLGRELVDMHDVPPLLPPPRGAFASRHIRSSGARGGAHLPLARCACRMC